MQNAITDLSRLIDAIQDNFTIGNGHWRESRNAIVEYLIDDQIDSQQWDSVESIVSQLESAHCAAGSFGDLIYTQDILDKLSNPAWREAIEVAIDSYTDAAGEAPDFSHDCMGYPDTFRLGNVVTFAVDWVSNEVAGYIRSLDRVYVVTEAVDSLDPSPEVTVFLEEYDAQEYVSERIADRMNYLVQHAQEAWTEEDREAHEEQEAACFRIDVESLQ